MREVDVCVLGAGPGGATAAIHLAKAGVSCLVVDRAVFPRDKICGDGLGTGVIYELDHLNPALLARLKVSANQLGTWGVHFGAPNGQRVSLPAEPTFNKETDSPGGYTMKRLDFDALLVDEMRQYDKIELLEACDISQHQRTADGRWHLRTADGHTNICARLVLVANGAQSTFARQVAGHQLDAEHHCAGLRAYYRGVKDLSPHNFIELHFYQALLPGYFWIFPLPNGDANVGVGMLTAAVSAKKVNLRALLQELITHHPNLKDRFTEAELLGPVRGFGLPLGSKRRSVSGEGYLLLGDAASLIDPVTGEGISHAMLSGRQAAGTAVRALAAQDFSAAFLSQYDEDINLGLGRQLQLSHLMQRMLRFPRLINFVASRAANNPRLSDTITNMFLSRDLRQQLRQPGFYVRLALGPRRGPAVRIGIRIFRAGMRTLRKIR